MKDIFLAERDGASITEFLDKGPCPIHLIGIGGVGMAGLAILLASKGFKISGSDTTANQLTERLQVRYGCTIHIGHRRENVPPSTDWAIRSNAIPQTNPEICALRERGIPVFLRGAVLANLCSHYRTIAITGTHGKTTTTNMVTQLLLAAGLTPSFCIGAEVNALNGNAAANAGTWLVVEADESDGTVALYKPEIAVVTNIELDHMEHFDGITDLENCYAKFVKNSRGSVIYGSDDRRCAKVCAAAPKALAYGFSGPALVRGQNFHDTAQGSTTTVTLPNNHHQYLSRLPIPGQHNATNALAAWAVGYELGIQPATIAQALANYRPAQRRFEKIYQSEKLTVISDYAHHPTEIQALLRMAKTQNHRRIIAIFQPHRYTRTLALGQDFPQAFAGVNQLFLLPVYAASEKPLPGGTSEDLYEHFRQYGKTPTKLVGSLSEAWERSKILLEDDDLLLILGAGDVEKIVLWAKDYLANK